MLNKWLFKENIQIVDNTKNWKDAVKLCGLPLINSGIVHRKYIKAVYQTHEKFGPYYVLMPNVAIPHARPTDGVFDTGLSLLLVKEGVSFFKDEFDPVNLIIMLAAKDNNSHIHLISSIAELLNNKASIERIINSMTIENVYTEISKY